MKNHHNGIMMAIATSGRVQWSDADLLERTL